LIRFQICGVLPSDTIPFLPRETASRDKRGEQDEIFEQHGIRGICDPKSYLYLNRTTIDFKDEVMGRGFVSNNPNAICGCGSSFSA